MIRGWGSRMFLDVESSFGAAGTRTFGTPSECGRMHVNYQCVVRTWHAEGTEKVKSAFNLKVLGQAIG